MFRNRIVVSCIVVLLVFALAGRAGAASSVHSQSSSPAALAAGPSDGGALLQFTSGGHALGFSAQGMYAAGVNHVLHVAFVGANTVQPQTDYSAVSNSKTAPLGRVSYTDLWDGIRLTYSGGADSIYTTTYSLVPGADAGRIRLRYNTPVKLNADGSLEIAFATGMLTESAPLAWQEIGGRRAPVQVAFRLDTRQDVAFELGAYDPNYALTIDPGLTWNTFLGGIGADITTNIAVDGSGNIYVAGFSSAAWGSPLRPYSALNDSNYDAFAAKLDASGNLLWNTFLGGDSEDYGTGIAVDGSGNIYVSGTSRADWGCLPTACTARPYTGVNGNSYNAFAVKLDSSGNLLWNTFLGAGNFNNGSGIAVDGSGNVFVSGSSAADWGCSPIACTVRAYSESDAFAAKLDSSGHLLWNTFLGASGSDEAAGIALDEGGNVYIVGYSEAAWGSPVQGYTGGADAFAAKLDASGNVIWSTFLGGDNGDHGYNVAVSDGGNIYITGQSNATWGSPLQAYVQYNTFVAKLDPLGNLDWSTFLGGHQNPFEGSKVVVDGDENIYVAGISSATWGTPLRSFSGNSDTFAAKLDPSGGLVANTFLGGEGIEEGAGIAVDGSGKVYVAGYSYDTGWGSPLHAPNGSLDAFVAKVDFTTYSISGNAGVSGAILNYNDGGVQSATADGSGNYSFIVSNGWSGKVIPSKTAYLFTPTSRSYAGVSADKIEQNYTAVRAYPDLLVPKDGAYLLNNRPDFEWTKGLPGTKYIIQVSRHPSFKNPVLNKIVSSSTYTPGADLPAGATLYWRVRRYTPAGNTPWSLVRSFTTARPPSVPGLVSPLQDARITDYTPRLDWTDSQVPAGTIFLKYQVQLVRDSNFDSTPIVNLIGPVTGSEYTPGVNLAPNIAYSWRVRAVNTFGEYSSWSEVRSFHTVIPDPVTKLHWVPAGSMLDKGRFNHTATLLPDGKVLVTGGSDGFPVGTTKLYDPTTKLWADTSPLLYERAMHTATLLSNGKVLVVGGVGNTSGILSAVELYDPATDSWASTGWLNTGRYAHSATLLADGKVLVAGGVSSNGILYTAELYDPDTETWTPTSGGMNAARYAHTSTLLPDGKVLVTGGDSSSDYLSSVELYDPSSQTWAMKAPMSTARRYNTATLLSDGRVLVAGGSGPHGLLVSAELYDPAADTWSVTGSLNQAHSSHTATLLPDDRVLIAGGVDGDQYSSVSAELYNPVTGNWKFTSSLIQARANHTATLLLNGQVLATGGSEQSSALASTELYIPAPRLLVPADTAQLLSNRPTFDWMDVTGATKYDLQVSKNIGFSRPVWDLAITSSSFVPVTDLPAGPTLYWRVRYYTTAGPGLWSLTRSFTTAKPPSIPVLLSPANTALMTDYTPRLDWANSSLPVGVDFQKYELQLSENDNTFASATSVDVSGLPGNSEYTPGVDLLPNTKYYWQVRAYNMDGQYSSWSAVRYFRTAILQPLLTAPTNASSTSDRTPTFTWDPVIGATSYVLQASKNSSFSILVLNTALVGNSFTVGSNLPPGTLYWRVRARGPNGPSLWSTFSLIIN